MNRCTLALECLDVWALSQQESEVSVLRARCKFSNAIWKFRFRLFGVVIIACFRAMTNMLFLFYIEVSHYPANPRTSLPKYLSQTNPS